MNINKDFETFVETPIQQLFDIEKVIEEDEYGSISNNTTPWMMRTVSWLKDLNGQEPSHIVVKVAKYALNILMWVGMILLASLVIGGFMIHWYCQAADTI